MCLTNKEEVLKRIGEIKKRVEGATDGPWAWDRYGEKVNCFQVGIAFDKNENPVEGRAETERYDPDSDIFVEEVLWKDGIGYKEGAVINYNDADFIAHSRTDVPFLIGFIEQLLKENSEK